MFPILNPSLLPPRTIPLWSSQCTSPKHPVSCIEPGLVIRFIYDMNSHLMLMSGIIGAWTDLCFSREDLLLHFLGACAYYQPETTLVSQIDHSGRIILNLTPVWMQHTNYRFLKEYFIATIFFYRPEFEKVISLSQSAKIFLLTLSLMLCPFKVHTDKKVSTISSPKIISCLCEY